MSKTKRGFTLIELLIVIGVIGLLASMVLVGLSGFRKSSRDARRISDMAQMRTVLERYFAQCGFYPIQDGRAGSEACPAIANASQPSKWHNEFGAELQAAGLIANKMKDIPQDVLARGTVADGGENHPYSYQYRVQLLPAAGSADALKYILRTKLEDAANAVLQNDIDNADIPDPDNYNNLDCDDGTGKNYYCVTF